MGLGNLGFFAGGVAQGVQSGSNIAFERQKLQLAQEELQADKDRKQQEQWAKTYTNTVKQVEQALKGISGDTPGPVVRTPQQQRDDIINQFEPLLTQHPYASKNPELAKAVVQSLRNTKSDVELKAEEVAATTKAKEEATTPALQEFSGFDPKTGKRFIGFTNNKGERWMPHPTEPNKLIPAHADVRIISTAEQGTSTELGLDKKERRDLNTEVRDSAASVDSVSSFLRDFRNNPGSSGLMGFLADKVGGVLGQVPFAGETLEHGLTNMLTGNDPETNSRVRTKSRVIIAQMLQEVTGEEGNRFTEQERKLAEDTLKTLKVGASPVQIITATKTMMEIAVASELRATENLGKPAFDLSKDEGVDRFGEYLVSLGFNDNDAMRIIVDNHSRQQQMKLKR